MSATPEELALACLDLEGVSEYDQDSRLVPENLQERIAAAIRQAVLVEREACARLADARDVLDVEVPQAIRGRPAP